MWRNIASNFLTVASVGLVILAGMLAWAQRQYNGPGPLQEAICFRVERGSSLSRVASELEQQGAKEIIFDFTQSGTDILYNSLPYHA